MKSEIDWAASAGPVHGSSSAIKIRSAVESSMRKSIRSSPFSSAGVRSSRIQPGEGELAVMIERIFLENHRQQMRFRKPSAAVRPFSVQVCQSAVRSRTSIRWSRASCGLPNAPVSIRVAGTPEAINASRIARTRRSASFESRRSAPRGSVDPSIPIFREGFFFTYSAMSDTLVPRLSAQGLTAANTLFAFRP